MHDTNNDIAALEQLMGRSRKAYRALQHCEELRISGQFPIKPWRIRPVILSVTGIMLVCVLIIGLHDGEKTLGIQSVNPSRLVAKRPKAMPLSLRPEGNLTGNLAFERPPSLRKRFSLIMPRRPTGYSG